MQLVAKFPWDVQSKHLCWLMIITSTWGGFIDFYTTPFFGQVGPLPLVYIAFMLDESM